MIILSSQRMIESSMRRTSAVDAANPIIVFTPTGRAAMSLFSGTIALKSSASSCWK